MDILSVLVTVFELISKLFGDKKSSGDAFWKRWEIRHNLPRPKVGFVGRKNDKIKVHEALRKQYNIISIEGMGGVGKSSLALEVAHECLQVSRWKKLRPKTARFTGFIWATAKGRELTLNNLLDIIATTLEQQALLSQTLEGKKISINKLFEKLPCLLIIDNYETITDKGIQEFIDEVPIRTKVIITTREKRFSSASPISLGNLPLEDAFELVRKESSRLNLESVVNASAQTLEELYRVTGGTPLALKWALGQIRQKGQTLQSVLLDIGEAQGDVFEQIFSRSWELLSDNANSQTLLKCMCLFAAPASDDALRAGSRLDDRDYQVAKGQLVEMSLLDILEDTKIGQRYTIHPLTQASVLSKLHESQDEKKQIINRLVNYFFNFSTPYKDWRHNVVDYSLLDPEIPTLFALIDLGLEYSLYHQVAKIFSNLRRYIFLHGYWNDAIEIAEKISEHALKFGDEERWARYQIFPISSVYRHRGEINKAMLYIDKALEVFGKHPPTKYHSEALRQKGRAFQEMGNYEEAEKYLQMTYQFCESNNLIWELLIVTMNLSELALMQHQYALADELCNKGFVLLQDKKDVFHDPEREAYLYLIKGQIFFGQKNVSQARKHIQESLHIMRELERPDGIADVLLAVGLLEKEENNQRKARSAFSEALALFRQMGIEKKASEVSALIEEL